MHINVLEYLEESAQKHSDKIVLSDDKNQLTYAQLLKNARSIGSHLISQLARKTNQPVAVVIDRTVESIVAFMGVVYSGNFYVPIDATMPLNRINLILNKLDPKAIILRQGDLDLIDKANFSGQKILFENACSNPINEVELQQVRTKAIDTDPLYSIFTSGSTGTPKGALICHRSVIDLIEHFAELFGFSEDSIFGNQAPFDFDVSVKDIYSTLKNGASMNIIPRSLFSFPVQLIQHLNAHRINTVIWATSALRIVANLRSFEKIHPEFLETIMFSGEVMPNKVLNYWRSNLPDAQFVNLYGPTEITCNCTYFKVTRSFADNDVLPIGIPFPNTEIILLNENNLPAGADEIGEICIRGTSLALGYYNNPQETSRAFCQNPLNPFYPELIYRTGDLGKYNDLGELLFLSRKDFQIKHMGHRIELGEIEVAANAISFIDAACCLYDINREKIVLFYQAAQQNNKEVVLNLQRYLPKYMIPNQFICMQSLPMNKNAKIDRQALKREYIDK
ncbi:Tyrocidine synthase 1 [bioreactor metagenome]|uniref:Tyrocidine synthase 1 n=1 Tax=bioreactor metagenome TaxID=1076179 RepID=A0A644XFG4_9ZZZZ